MPHIEFNYLGLGEAYRVFAQKHAQHPVKPSRDLQRVRDGVEAMRVIAQYARPGDTHNTRGRGRRIWEILDEPTALSGAPGASR